jgi:hypothetical protein
MIYVSAGVTVLLIRSEGLVNTLMLAGICAALHFALWCWPK